MDTDRVDKAMYGSEVNKTGLQILIFLLGICCRGICGSGFRGQVGLEPFICWDSGKMTMSAKVSWS